MSAGITELLNDWWPAIGLLLIAALLGWLGKAILIRNLKKLSSRTATRADDALIDALGRYWLPAVVLAAAIPAARVAPLAPDSGLVIERFALSALLLVVTLTATRFVGRWFTLRQPVEKDLAGRPSLVQKITQAAVLIAGTLLILDNAGVEIKTLLTALGVGSLAVALALQPTLSNLFAGLHLSVAKPIRVGDYIELEDGVQGHVVDIGWRATRIRQLANNLVIVPNAKLVDMRILNYALPDSPQSVLVGVGVAYGSDLRQVELVTVEVARALQTDLPEADSDHDPFIRYHTFGSSSVDFNVVLRANSYTDRWPLVHEFIVRLKQRFDAEGIEIPFPQRVVHMPEPGAAGAE
jgi:small-conductance mechanosensitive channel